MSAQNTVLNTYLTRLDQALGKIPVSDRAEIVLEIKSHIEDALASGAELSATLSSLGEAEMVANRYLLERGLQPQRAPRHPMVKWLTIGFLGTVAMMCVTLLIVLWSFTPLVKVDEKAGRVQILGGLIDVKDSNISKGKESHPYFSGAMPLNAGQVFDFKFSNANLEFRTSDSNEAQWKCEVETLPPEAVEAKMIGSTLSLDVEALEGVDCVIKLPARTRALVRGANGNVEINKPSFAFDAEMANGQFDFQLDETREYAFDLSFVNGVMMPQNLKSSKSKDALLLRAKVKNGRITVDEN